MREREFPHLALSLCCRIAITESRRPLFGAMLWWALRRNCVPLSPFGAVPAIVRAMRLDSFLLALSTFFATIGPADLVLVFAALTERMTTKERRIMALRGTLIATGIIVFFAVFG
jgi:hypothetical protein